MINIQKHLEFYRNIAAVNSDGSIIDFKVKYATTRSLNLKQKITGKTGDSGTKDVEIMVPLKCLSNFWRTVEMALINCEINLDRNWSKNSARVANNANQDNISNN